MKHRNHKFQMTNFKQFTNPKFKYLKHNVFYFVFLIFYLFGYLELGAWSLL